MRSSSSKTLANAILLALLCAVPAHAAGPAASYVYPLMGTRVSSDYGVRRHPVIRSIKHHDGTDLAAPKGAAIRAVRAGTVVFADPHGSYGKLIVIQHENGMTTHYGHCDTIKAQPGRRVRAGELIGTVGSTGRVTGPHLHFEIRLNGKPQDPERFIPGLAESAKG